MWYHCRAAHVVRDTAFHLGRCAGVRPCRVEPAPVSRLAGDVKDERATVHLRALPAIQHLLERGGDRKLSPLAALCGAGIDSNEPFAHVHLIPGER